MKKLVKDPSNMKTNHLSHEILLNTQELTLEIYKAQKCAHETKSWENKYNVSVQKSSD